MNVERDAAFEACFDSGVAGQVGIASLMLVDNDGGIYWPASITGIVESPPASGIYCANRTAPTIVGQYTLVWSVDGTYDPQTVGIENLQVFSPSVTFPPLVPSDPDGGAIVGPCNAWTVSEDIWNCCGQPVTTIGEGSSEEEIPVDMTVFATEASQMLYELSGRLYSGTCEKTVIACEDSFCGCGIQVLSRGHVVGPWNGGGSTWLWSCGCPSTIKLSGYPVREVTEVVIGGITLDPTAYKLYDRYKLARVDGGSWPNCDSICEAGTEDDNTITYTYGQDPPSLGSAAAAQLGCELYRACAGVACALPTGTTRINRQGIVIERLAFATWAFIGGRWNTGLPLVDAFLGAYNPTALKRRPSVWSASSRRYARSVGS